MSINSKQLISLLERARTKIKGGWVKGAAAKNESGKTVSPTTKTATCFCATGAIDACTRSTDLRYEAIRELALGTSRMSWEYFSAGVVQSFNDAPGRKKAEVVKLFSQAIKRLRALYQ